MLSEVEALLSVDAGRVPPGAVVFPAADPEAPARRAYLFLALVAGISAVGSFFSGLGLEPVVLLGIIAAILAVLAVPTTPEPEEARHKQPTLVVTPYGMIVRNHEGLRSWRFDELASVHPYVFTDGEGLLLVKRDGSREFLDCLGFRQGDRVAEVIGRHIRPRAI
jgi:hypothetical protein